MEPWAVLGPAQAPVLLSSPPTCAWLGSGSGWCWVKCETMNTPLSLPHSTDGKTEAQRGIKDSGSQWQSQSWNLMSWPHLGVWGSGGQPRGPVLVGIVTRGAHSTHTLSQAWGMCGPLHAWSLKTLHNAALTSQGPGRSPGPGTSSLYNHMNVLKNDVGDTVRPACLLLASAPFSAPLHPFQPCPPLLPLWFLDPHGAPLGDGTCRWNAEALVLTPQDLGASAASCPFMFNKACSPTAEEMAAVSSCAL